MIFKKVILSNIRVFKYIEFDLNNRGLVGITGKNGVGKTTIFNAIRALFFGGMNDGSKWDELVRNNRDAQICIEAQKGDKEYKFDLSRIKNKWVLTILENGVDITKHSQVDAKKQPREILGMTPDEWDAVVHLSQSGSHILVSGKPSQRKEYISQFFGLDGKFDEVEAACKNELEEVNKKIREIEQFGPTKQALQDELSLIIIPDAEADRHKLNDLNTRKDLINQKVTEFEGMVNTWNQYHIYSAEAYPTGFEGVDPDNAYDFYIKEQVEMQNRRKSSEHAITFNLKVASNNQKYEELVAKVAGLKPFADRNPQGYAAMNQEILELKSKQKASKSRTPILTKLSAYEGLQDAQVVDTTAEESELKSVTANLAVLNQKYTSIQSGKCPTCGSEFKHDHLMDIYNEIVLINARSLELSNQISAAITQNKRIGEYSALKSQLDGIPEFTSNEELQLSSLESDAPHVQLYEESKRNLDDTQKMEPIEVLTPPTEVEIAQNRVNVDFFRKMKDARAKCPTKLPEVNLEACKSTLSQLTLDKAKIEQEVIEISSKLMSVQQEQDRYDRIRKQISDIDLKFQQLPKFKELELFWKEMIKAYGPKGLRVAQLERVMSMVLQVLPVYTSRMFSEKSFAFKASCDAGNIEITATRTDEEGSYTNDIATLSGGEKKRMAVCLVLAVARARLSRKKVNMVILDEVDSQVDVDGRYLFVNEVLPMIREEFESVFVISHSEEVKQASMYDEILHFSQKPNIHYTEVESVKT